MEETRPCQPRQRRLLSSYLLRSRDWADWPPCTAHTFLPPLLAPEILQCRQNFSRPARPALTALLRPSVFVLLRRRCRT